MEELSTDRARTLGAAARAVSYLEGITVAASADRLRNNPDHLYGLAAQFTDLAAELTRADGEKRDGTDPDPQSTQQLIN